MKLPLKKTAIVEIISALFILLFVYTGISKLLNYEIFRIQSGFAPILRPYSEFIAIFIPIVELSIVVLYFIRSTKLLALYASITLMITFTIYIAWMLLSGLNLPCTCGGIITSMSWKQHLIFNIAFIGLAFTGILLKRQILKATHQQIESMSMIFT